MNSEWKIEVDNFGGIRVSGNLIDELSKYRQLSSSSPESGGVILGSHLNSGGKLYIDRYTPPQQEDKQTRCSHFRSSTHSSICQKIWEETQGHTTFLGLWHTHPEPIPMYSSVDKADWIKALKKAQYEGHHLLFFIIGQSHIRCWLGSKGALFQKIKLIGEYEINKYEVE